MPKSFFLVRVVVAEPLHDKFDHWTSADHLPRALKDFKAENARLCSSFGAASPALLERGRAKHAALNRPSW
ncbi:MAG: hypothetical protein HY543_02525 [Deltaproteobacteria bacterium]|nr:hypothetical protein [Deltaproteobacteria bacterium]